jgi:hypothetical protein
MKRLSIIFLLFVSCLTTSTKNQYTKNQDPMLEEELSVQENKVPSTVKSHIIRFVVVGTLLFKQKEIVQSIKNHPYIAMAIVGLFIKYISDSHKKHGDVKKDFDTLQMIQELYDLILYAVEINNIMMQVSPPTRSFNTLEHFDKIVQDVPYSFDELEKITQHILIKWKLKIKHKYPSLYTPTRGSNKTTTYIKDVDDAVYYFYKNPLESYQHACKKIAYKIKLIVQSILRLKIIDSL